MAFSSITRAIARTGLGQDLVTKLESKKQLSLNGIPRLPKGLIASALAQAQQRPLLAVAATLEEAGRWAAQLEAMGWGTVAFYPTSESSPYDVFDPESELIWGQLQVLSDLSNGKAHHASLPPGSKHLGAMAIVATERALQPHLPPPEAFRPYCLEIVQGMELNLKELARSLAKLGYEKVSTVETEGQWSQRGDIIDVFPVAAELPVRLELFGDELERLREFDPANQRSLDKIETLLLTTTDYGPIISAALDEKGLLEDLLTEENLETFTNTGSIEGVRRFMGLAFDSPASLLDYLPENTVIALDEPDQCQAHAERWLEAVEDRWEETQEAFETADDVQLPKGGLPKLHREFDAAIAQTTAFQCLHLSEIAEEGNGMNLGSRPVPILPHQFGKLADILKEERDRNFSPWLVSAQPSRSVALLQEHDCPAQFIPNPRDYPAIDKLQNSHIPIAVKYSGLAELEGFILPSFRIVLVTDREFFGQHTLATPSYVRKRRRAASKQVDPNKLQPKDYVVHRNHGIGQFIKLDRLTVDSETREYLVIQYADGLLRVAVDQLASLSRYRTSVEKRPQLNKMTGKTWAKTKGKAKKAIQKVAVDLLKLYAKRAQMEGYNYPVDMPWQQELEDSFPYNPTPDQLKATQDVKRDMESDRPMDRLVCGDVGFGKTEVAVRAIFKAVTAGKQVALLAPTTILTQQHYHTLKERFAPYPIQIGLLNRFRTAKERKDILVRLISGELDVVVGTHQLLGKTVKFKDLGLLVVDEEQRFGVNQKEKIKAMKAQVDVLTLSATPIPRTLYMALSGVREMSLITTP
ncbi:MAG: DEAD/DEAH box helicase, partial [Cyanobacteria bacterium J06632_3]